MILEAKLAVALYENAGPDLQLTQAAEIVLSYARELLAQNDSARAAVEEFRRE